MRRADLYSLALAVGLGLPGGARAAEPLKVVVQEVMDDRFSKGILSGSLRVTLAVQGDGADGVKAARFVPKDVKDDVGTALLGKERKESTFERLDQSKSFRLDLVTPPRKATSIQISGKVELFVPSKDKGSTVKVAGALSKKDKPIVAPGLKAAKIEVSVLSKAAYAEVQKKQRIDDKKEAELRAEGKRRGASDEEVDAVIKLAKAFQEMGESDVPENAVILSGRKADMDRIIEIGLEKPDGEGISANMSSSSDGTTTTSVFRPREPLGDETLLVFTILTEKAKTTLPVDLKSVPLP